MKPLEEAPRVKPRQVRAARADRRFQAQLRSLVGAARPLPGSLVPLCTEANDFELFVDGSVLTLCASGALSPRVWEAMHRAVNQLAEGTPHIVVVIDLREATPPPKMGGMAEAGMALVNPCLVALLIPEAWYDRMYWVCLKIHMSGREGGYLPMRSVESLVGYIGRRWTDPRSDFS
jgi:hypothetical protein